MLRPTAPPHLLTVAALVLVVPLRSWSDDFEERARERDAQTLLAAGMQATSQGALEYLESLVPEGDPNAIADGLIEQLGADEFERREQAATKLLNLPALPRKKLEAALTSQDAEIRWRARIVLSRLGSTGNRTFHAALREVARHPPPGTVAVLLRLATLDLGQPQSAIYAALRSTATPRDQPQLKAAAGEGRHPLTRLAAVHTLGVLSDDAESLDLLVPLLNHAEPRIVLLAAQQLGNAGDRRALAALAGLIPSNDVAVANDALSFLSTLADHDFGYPDEGNAASRGKVVAEVERWIAAEGATAKLNYPVAEPAMVRGDLSGHTLVATGGGDRVVLFDSLGKVVWSYGISAWSAEKLTNGNVLIASYQTSQVLEVNREGTVVWSQTGISAMRAKPLANGHLLIADFQGNRVVELTDDAQRQEVWSVKTNDNCFDAERLPNGHTVFACPNAIVEVNQEGQTIRELKIQGRANSIQVLSNGHWLVANHQKNAVEQYDREGKIVWSFEEAGVCDAFRLRNGKTLITSTRRAIELAADRKTIREICEAKYGGARR